MAIYRLTQNAGADLLDIFGYSLQTFGVDQADKYRDDLVRCFQLLADNPHLGRKSEQFAAETHRHEHASHVIFYDEESGGILILAIIHKRREPKTVPGISTSGTEI